MTTIYSVITILTGFSGLVCFVDAPEHSVIQFIPPRAAQTRHDIATGNFALHGDWRYDAECAQPPTLHEPRQRLIDRARICKRRMAQMRDDATGADARQCVCMCAFGGVGRVQRRPCHEAAWKLQGNAAQRWKLRLIRPTMTYHRTIGYCLSVWVVNAPRYTMSQSLGSAFHRARNLTFTSRSMSTSSSSTKAASSSPFAMSRMV